MQNHKVQRLDIAEVARLGRENDQTSGSQDIKLKPDDERPKVDKSLNQTAGAADNNSRTAVNAQSLSSGLDPMLCYALLCCAEPAAVLHP